MKAQGVVLSLYQESFYKMKAEGKHSCAFKVHLMFYMDLYESELKLD